MADSKVAIALTPFDPPPAASAYGGGLTAPVSKNQTLPDGGLDNQMQVLTHKDESLAASGTNSYDMQLDEDRYGEAIAAADVVLLYVEHKASSSASSISFRPAAANGWTSFVSAGATLTLQPGDFMILGAFAAGNQAVSPTSKIMEVVNNDGVNAADYLIQFWNRKS